MMADQLKQAGNQAQSTAGAGTEKWNAMTEDQKKEAYNSLPSDQKKGKTYMEWISEGYQHQKENWMPWVEDMYLKWFTNDNKASYATKDTLDKSKVTGIEQVDTLQDGVNNAVGQQFGKGGILQPVGDTFSKEGINRAERKGKGTDGSYGGAASSVTDPVVNNAQAGGQAVASGAQSAGNSVWSGAKSAGGYVGGMFGGGKKEGEAQQK